MTEYRFKIGDRVGKWHELPARGLSVALSLNRDEIEELGEGRLDVEIRRDPQPKSQQE